MTDTDEKVLSLAKMPTSKIQELADGHYSERKGLSGDEILQPTHELLRQLEQALNRAYLLTYLEAKLRCDEFFEGKLHAGDVGEKYGYINSRVEMNKGSIDMYFQSKRPGQDGFFKRKRITKAKKTGYAESKLRRYAASEFEANLAMHTEMYYKGLRDQADKIKRAQKLLREIETFTLGD